MTDDRQRRRLGPLPVWAWVVLAIVLVIVLVVLGFLLFSRGGGPKDASPSPSPTLTSASPTPTPTVSASATPTPAATAGSDVGQGTFASEMDSYMGDVLNSQNTAVLAQGGTFSNPVFVLAANSGLTQDMTPDEAVGAMDFMFTPGDPNPWDLALSPSTLEGYRAGPYGAYFPVGAIVARSHDGHVFSFIGHGSTITTMFMAASEDLLH
ncbi:MAG TPA: hypothetical protein VNS80_00885 [Pseudolysinimonas sp.]|nr:hypothetical protein [Pseudolysinimonas sp.]